MNSLVHDHLLCSVVIVFNVPFMHCPFHHSTVLKHDTKETKEHNSACELLNLDNG